MAVASDTQNKTHIIRLKNFSTECTFVDKLNQQVVKNSTCSDQVCLGSQMAQDGKSSSLHRPKEEVLTMAKQFIDEFYASINQLDSEAHVARSAEVESDIETKGTYHLTGSELAHGAKLAWRNSVRCIGRIQWSKLQVFDCRNVTTAKEMFEALCKHLEFATNHGNIRSAITVFRQRTNIEHDFRVWNPQMIAYAGYTELDGTVKGDPANNKFTELCMSLGWKGKGTRWDVLPLVLSADGQDPEYFDIPPELVLEVTLSHPTFDWFLEMGLRWYAVPGVSNMLFDCGGLQFPAAPFNGWYMSTEIGCRDLCDHQRFNILEDVAARMGLDTSSPVTLWKDKALVEVNLAVLHSFQMLNVTIVDHHTASESFLKHMDNEQKLRRGCPADWVWIVPPMSGSVTPVFHQEMAVYYLKPSYEYQEPAWNSVSWKKRQQNNKPTRKYKFKVLVRCAQFTLKLFGRTLSRRTKATVLFATETGRSEMYARKLCEIFNHAFNSQVCCMQDYDISSIEHEALLLVVTSTFGSGDPPENGVVFSKQLKNMNNKAEKKFCAKFSVFALGSTSYPNFCGFGKLVDNLLGELGGERLLKCGEGDEMSGQEKSFTSWAKEVFSVACKSFGNHSSDAILDTVNSALNSDPIGHTQARFVKAAAEYLLITSLERCYKKETFKCHLSSRRIIRGGSGSTLMLELVCPEGVSYQPGDHVGLFACNREELVDGLLSRLRAPDLPADWGERPVQLQFLQDKHTTKGPRKKWEAHAKYPACSLRTLFSRFLDITTPPAPSVLRLLAAAASDPTDRDALTRIAEEPGEYEGWRDWRYPHLLEVLEQFPSSRPEPALLVAQLSPLQPRFYSISSSPRVHPASLQLTVAVVTYHTQEGSGCLHYGVCSNYLKEINIGDAVYLYTRSAPGFHLPQDISSPVIMIGPGTGIAPFRGFWEHRLAEIKNENTFGDCGGSMWLFFGCRQRTLNLYRDEKAAMMAAGVLQRVFLALSREPSTPKTYVQDLIRAESLSVYRQVVLERGHFYVCGDCTMAEHVYRTLRDIIKQHGELDDADVESYMLSLRDENRYHEDIFGNIVRAPEGKNHSSREEIASSAYNENGIM